ncbi:MAG: glutathione S-transferase family protein [Rhodobacteraceae bacterium]|nr:glutathione S-transferase family protein [Paracoccaceae bacterium]
MYKVYGLVPTRSLRVLWALEEMGQPYELIKSKPQGDAILAVNPTGKVPALQDGDDIITDSVAIMTHLADKHGQLTYPFGSIERAHLNSMLCLLQDELDAVLWTAARHSFVLPEEHRVPQVKKSLQWEFARNLEQLEKHITGPYLVGDQMTIADILFTHCLNWAYSAKFPVESQRVRDYAKSMRNRDAFKRAVANAD